MALLLALLLLLPAAQVQKAAPAERPREILELVARARAVPPEFGADVLLRIAASGRVADPAWKRELLEEAFHLAAGAREPVRRAAVVTLHNGNSRSNYRAQGFDFNLDTLSLQGRAVQAMFPLDRKRALKLLGEVRVPDLPPQTCDDVFAYRIDDFYTDVVREVADGAFTPEEVRRGENFSLIESYLKDLRSPAQLSPIATLLAEAKLTSAQFAQLVQVYSAILANIPSDPRSGEAYWQEAGIQGLARACREKGISSFPLLNAYRSFLVRRLSRRCSDSSRIPAERWEMERRTALFSSYDRSPGDPEIPPIVVKELTVETIKGRYEEPAFWQDPVAKQLHATLNDLRGRADLRADRTQWETRFNEFIGQLAGWTGTSEKSEADYFHQKALLTWAAFQAAPRGSFRDGLLRSYVVFLASSGVRQTSPAEWLVQANPVIQLLLSARAEERDEVLAVIRNAQEPVLWLYAELGRLQ